MIAELDAAVLALTALWLAGAVATDMVAIYALVCSKGFCRIGWALLSQMMIYLSFVCLRRVVLVVPLGVTYALWCVFGIFGTLAMGALFFRQRVTRQEQIGIALLTLGIVCMSLA